MKVAKTLKKEKRIYKRNTKINSLKSDKKQVN